MLPGEAHAKITCRLVPDQNPTRIVALIAAHVEQHSPPGATVTVRSLDAGAKPYLIPADHPGNQAAKEVLTEMYSREPYHVRMGGTIPVCALFLDHLGTYTVVYAFGLHDERTHAPNEFFRISSFKRSQRAYGLLLKRLGKGGL